MDTIHHSGCRRKQHDAGIVVLTDGSTSGRSEPCTFAYPPAEARAHQPAQHSERRMEAEGQREMPMCLRAHRFLLPSAELERGHWRCDGRPCSGEAHDYILDGGHSRDSVDRALAYAMSRFGLVSLPDITVWSSPGAEELPETTLGLDDKVAVYLTATDEEQSRYQAGHESFHALFTPIGTHHWLHELLAVVFALEFLHVEGLDYHRQRQINADDRSRSVLSLAEFVSIDSGPYPPGTYERASIFGRNLARVTGSDVLFEARDCWNEASGHCPDYWAWVDGLPRRIRRRVISLGPNRVLTR
jgi:hypothetical protein